MNSTLEHRQRMLAAALTPHGYVTVFPNAQPAIDTLCDVIRRLHHGLLAHGVTKDELSHLLADPSATPDPGATGGPRPPLADIVLPVDLLEADGDFNQEPAHTRLSHHVLINGQYFHLEAVQVKYEDDRTVAINPDLQDDVDQLFELLGDTPQRTLINGREYVLYLMPYAQ